MHAPEVPLQRWPANEWSTENSFDAIHGLGKLF